MVEARSAIRAMETTSWTASGIRNLAVGFRMLSSCRSSGPGWSILVLGCGESAHARRLHEDNTQGHSCRAWCQPHALRPPEALSSCPLHPSARCEPSAFAAEHSPGKREGSGIPAEARPVRTAGDRGSRRRFALFFFWFLALLSVRRRARATLNVAPLAGAGIETRGSRVSVGSGRSRTPRGCGN